MITFKEVNQVRLALKMKLCYYHWYNSSVIVADGDGFSILVLVKVLDNKVRKVISPVIDGVSVRVDQKN
jgi:hypothetical protein